MNPHVSMSVIIPCFNGMPYVLEAVESVLNQANESIEILVIDDGSKDGSGEAVEQAFGNRVRVVRQPNAGVAATRNRGLAESTGELVIWLDADDRLLPATLSLRQRAFVEDPALEMLVGANQFVDLDSGTSKRTPIVCDSDYLVSCLLPGFEQPHLNSMTFRRSALQRIGGFDSTVEPCEDLDFWFRAWAELRWRFLNTLMAWHRLGSHSHLMGRTPPVQRFIRRARAMEINRSLVRVHAGSDQPWRREYASWATTVSLLFLEAGRRGEAARWALRAIRIGRRQVRPCTYKFLLEALLSPSIYRVGARGARWLRKRLRLGSSIQSA